MLYRTCKRMIERGSIEGMSTKLDVFYAAGKLTDDEYKELTDLLAEYSGQDWSGLMSDYLDTAL